MPLIDLISCLVQIAALAYLSAAAVRAALLNRNIIIYKLIAGAFACYLTGALFWLLHYYIRGDWPHVFSPNDLAFIGYYCFLLSANLSLIESWTERQKQAAGKYRLPALAASAIVLVFHIAYVKMFGNIINNLIFLLPLSLWGYFSLWPLLACRKSPARNYYAAVSLALAFELLIFLFSYNNLYFLFTYLQIAGWFFILPAARKAVEG